ncbi:MAG: TonB-dependent receptor plug domain-containing protein, partial [Solimonas sp.]
MSSFMMNHAIKRIGDKTPFALAVASLFGSQPLWAQQADAAPIEEIVVTATGRSQAVQDVPYNISVVTESDLKAAGVTDTARLARQVPGLSYSDLGPRSNGISSGIILRGLNG